MGRLGLFGALVFLWVSSLVGVPLAEGQAPGGGLSPFAPPTSAPSQPASEPPKPEAQEAPAAASPEAVSAQPAQGADAPAPTAPLPSVPTPAPRRASTLDPVLFTTEGLEALVDVAEFKRRLGEALGRELVSLLDPRAHEARAMVQIGVAPEEVVVRVTPPQRAEVWRKFLRSQLGADPGATLVKAVLEMFWADAFARLDAAELQDPFCPPGIICIDTRRSYPWPPVPEPEVLDPWDTSYRRFYGWDPFAYPSRHAGSAALTAPYPGRYVRATPQAPDAYWRERRPDASPPDGDRAHDYALSFFTGGGVHKGGAFFRYEFNAVRRFPRFDFGLAFIGGRGQPEPPTKARRAITALLARRFVADEFELDLGASFGTFFATLEDHELQVRPYLRGMVTFVIPVGRLFDFLVQSDFATTFTHVPNTGVVEYALSAGLRHRM